MDFEDGLEVVGDGGERQEWEKLLDSGLSHCCRGWIDP